MAKVSPSDTRPETLRREQAQVTVCDACRDNPEAKFHEGDATWHDGAGWYYVDAEYTDEGSCGAFSTRDAAVEHAREAGYYVGDDPCEHMS